MKICSCCGGALFKRARPRGACSAREAQFMRSLQDSYPSVRCYGLGASYVYMVLGHEVYSEASSGGSVDVMGAPAKRSHIAYVDNICY